MTRRPAPRVTRPPLARGLAAAGVVAVVAVAQVGLVLAPSQMNEHPLLVLALRPTPAFLVLVGDAVNPAAAVAIAAIGRTLVDVAYFAVARYGALPIAQRFGIGRKLSSRLSRPIASRGLLTVTFFWSSTPVIAAIGIGKTPLWRFAAVTGAGNAVTSSVFVFFGHQLSENLEPVNRWLAEHGSLLSLVIGLAVVGSIVATLRRSASERRRPEDASTASTTLGSVNRRAQ